MDAPDTQTTVESWLLTPSFLSESVLVQLALAFIISPVRADPFVVAPLVALYAIREADRRAMLLYVVMTVAACPLDLIFLASPGAVGFLFRLLTFASLLLKAALLYPAVKAHDQLPSTRPERVDPARLQIAVAKTMEDALREEVQRLASHKPTRVPPPTQPQTPAADPAAATPSAIVVPSAAAPALARALAAQGARSAASEGWDEV